MNTWTSARFREELAFLVIAAVAIGVAASAVASSKQGAFFAENTVAMNKMMRAMAIKPSGDIDRDFASMMIPHHQGAIDMAQSELRYGRNEPLRRIAQGIVVEQQQEIAAMQLALDRPPRPSGAAPTKSSDSAAAAASMPMRMHMPSHHHAD